MPPVQTVPITQGETVETDAELAPVEDEAVLEELVVKTVLLEVDPLVPSELLVVVVADTPVLVVADTPVLVVADAPVLVVVDPVPVVADDPMPVVADDPMPVVVEACEPVVVDAPELLVPLWPATLESLDLPTVPPSPVGGGTSVSPTTLAHAATGAAIAKRKKARFIVRTPPVPTGRHRRPRRSAQSPAPSRPTPSNGSPARKRRAPRRPPEGLPRPQTRPSTQVRR